MPHFVFAYDGGKAPQTPEETEQELGRWRSWFDHIGAAIVDPGNPFGMPKTVSAASVSDDGSANSLSGYSIIHTESIDQAIELAKVCPIIGDGSIELAEIHEVPA